MKKVRGKIVNLAKLIYAYTTLLLVFSSLFTLIALIVLVIVGTLVEFWLSNKILFVIAMLFLINYAIIGLNWVIEFIK